MTAPAGGKPIDWMKWGSTMVIYTCSGFKRHLFTFGRPRGYQLRGANKFGMKGKEPFVLGPNRGLGGIDVRNRS
jgi:hypothetical protein